MSFVESGSAIVLWAAALVSAATAGAAWRLRSRSSGGAQFAAMMIGIVIWCLMEGMEAAAVGVNAKVLFSKLGYIGTCSVAPLFISFALAYGGKHRFGRLPRALIIWTLPVVTLLLAATNERHHLVWSAFSPLAPGARNLLLYGHGPWYWVWVAYAAVATCAATAVLLQSAPGCSPFFRRQVFVFILGAAMPWTGAAVYLSPQNPLPGLDFTSVGFALAGGLFLLGVSRFRIFDVVPVPRGDLVEIMTDGLVVLDGGHRVLDINAAAQKMLGVGPAAIGKNAMEALVAIRKELGSHDAGRQTHFHGVILPDQPDRRLDIVIAPLGRELEDRPGRLLFLRDAAPGGLIPMCASCRRVRDDEGEWQSLEHYIERNSGIRFSHGLCDDCVTRLYPGLDIGKSRKE